MKTLESAGRSEGRFVVDFDDWAACRVADMDDSKQSVAVFDPESDAPVKPKRGLLRSVLWSGAHLLVGMGLSFALLSWWQARHLSQSEDSHDTAEVDTSSSEQEHSESTQAHEHGSHGDSHDEASEDVASEPDEGAEHASEELPEESIHDAVMEHESHGDRPSGHSTKELAAGNSEKEPREATAGDLSKELLGRAGENAGNKDRTQAQRLSDADIEYVAGNLEQSLKLYNDLLGEASRIPAERLFYRRALCFEGLGERDQALQEYQRLAKSETDTALAAACVVGQSRIFTSMKRLDAARALLYSQMMKLAREPRVLSHVMHQMTYLATLEAMDGLGVTSQGTRLIELKSIVSPLYSPENEDLLRLAQSTASEKQDKVVAAVEPGVHLLKRLGEGPQEIHLSVRVEEKNLPDLLDEISVGAGVPLELDESVRALLAKRFASGTITELDLATLLDSLLEPSGVSWSLDQGKIRIWAIHDLSREELSRVRRERADRHGKSALTFFPDDEQAAMTFLCLGNVRFWQDEYLDAIRWYRRAEGPGKVGPWLSAAWFNHAKSHILLGQRDDAREAFFRTADLSRRKELESISYAYLGRLYLDDGRVDEAIRELNRALQGTSAIPEAAISLAAAYLLIENPETANMILYKYREQVQTSEFDTQAMVVSALARLQATSNEAARVRQGRELASALAAAEPQRFFSAVGYLIVGKGYEQIGQPGEMEAVFQSAIRDLPACVLRDQMAYMLGEYMVDEHRWDEAEALFEPLVKGERRSQWSRKSQLAMADLAYARNDLDRCLQVCYDLIGNTDSLEEKESLLRLMGQCYERKSDHYRAAICFAGMIPLNETSSADSPR